MERKDEWILRPGQRVGGSREDDDRRTGWDGMSMRIQPLSPSLGPFPSSSLAPLPFVGTKWVMALMVGE